MLVTARECLTGEVFRRNHLDVRLPSAEEVTNVRHMSPDGLTLPDGVTIDTLMNSVGVAAAFIALVGGVA